jgi:cobalt-zinc-cadmium efflux system outer membrane protein
VVVWITCVAGLVGGCASADTPVNRAWVSERLAERTGFAFPADSRERGNSPGQSGVLQGGMTEDDAVRVALRHNAFFLEQLAELGLTRADVIQAGLVPNPDLNVLFPVGAKQMELTATVPLEVLWLRDRRIAAARAAAESVGDRLVQGGLELIRDVRVAYADLFLARERVRLLEESARLWDRIADLADARVRAGEASPLDVTTARIDAMRARGEAERAIHDADLTEQRFRNIMGLTDNSVAIRLEPQRSAAASTRPTTLPAASAPSIVPVEPLVDEALSTRPDLVAADAAVDAARKRAATARGEVFTFAFVADANERGDHGWEAGPGMRLQIPVFNQNQGNIARADAEVERAERHRQTVRNQAALEVRVSHRRIRQASDDLDAWGGRIRPALEDAVTAAEKAYSGGGVALLVVLETNRQLVDARIREVQAVADLRRARAELERAVGRRVDGRRVDGLRVNEPPPNR